jgi:hypothetical protein
VAVMVLYLTWPTRAQQEDCYVQVEVFNNMQCEEEYQDSSVPSSGPGEEEFQEDHKEWRREERGGGSTHRHRDHKERRPSEERRPHDKQHGEPHDEDGDDRDGHEGERHQGLVGCCSLRGGCNKVTTPSSYYLLRVNCAARTVALVGDDECQGPPTIEWGGSQTSCGGVAPTLSFRTTFSASKASPLPPPPYYGYIPQYTVAVGSCSAAGSLGEVALLRLWRRLATMLFGLSPSFLELR